MKFLIINDYMERISKQLYFGELMEGGIERAEKVSKINSECAKITDTILDKKEFSQLTELQKIALTRKLDGIIEIINSPENGYNLKMSSI